MWSDIDETWEIMIGETLHRIEVHNRGEIFRDTFEITLDRRKVFSLKIKHADLTGSHSLQLDGQTLTVYWKFNASTGKPISVVLMHVDQILAHYRNIEAAPIASFVATPSKMSALDTSMILSVTEMAEKTVALVTQGFNLDELKSLCFDLGIAFDNLAGETLDAKARELVAYHQRRGELSRLLSVIRARRPNLKL